MKSNISEVVKAFKDLEEYSWESSLTRTQFLKGFKIRLRCLQKCGVDLSEEYIGLRLLKASSLDKLGETLASIRCGECTYSNVQDLIINIYKDLDNEVSSRKQQPARHSSKFNQTNSGDRGQAEEGEIQKRGWVTSQVPDTHASGFSAHVTEKKLLSIHNPRTTTGKLSKPKMAM